MTIRVLIAFLLFSGLGFAQTKSPAKASAPSKSRVPVKAQADLDAANEKLKQVTKERDEYKLSSEVISLQLFEAKAMMRVVDKEANNAVLSDEDRKIISQVHPGEILDLASAIETDHNNQVEMVQRIAEQNDSLVKKYNALVDSFNELRQTAINQLDQANARLARANQINNAMAVYSLMPRYTPPPPIQIYQPSQPLRLQTNCMSQTIGTSTFTNCN